MDRICRRKPSEETGRRPSGPVHSTPSRGDVLASGRYDPEGEDELTAAAVYAVADVEGGRARDATSPLLYDCVDVAALERLRSPPRSARGRPLSGT